MTDETSLRGFGELLRSLAARSAPTSRGLRHLLLLDINDTYRAALERPTSLRADPPS